MTWTDEIRRLAEQYRQAREDCRRYAVGPDGWWANRNEMARFLADAVLAEIERESDGR